MMRGLVLFLVAALAVQGSPLDSSSHLAKWDGFKKTHGKAYGTATEELKRFNIFTDNLRAIEQHNEEFKAGKHTFEMGMNQFGDLTNEEFRSRVNGFRVPAKKVAATNIFKAPATKDTLPDSVDWRPLGYVTDVKDQGSCGSCWAFSTTGSLEGQHFKQTGKLVSLSEQNLIDCNVKFGNDGCGGGYMDIAFDYIKSNNGLDTEASYPYQGIDGKCRFNAANIGATDTGFVHTKSGSESDLESAIASVGPISVAIDASHPSFQFYNSSVYYESSCSSTQLDHGVLAVGYGVDSNGVKYYIVKNSWGQSWGDQGYILMSRERNNNCGIATSASYPDV